MLDIVISVFDIFFLACLLFIVRFYIVPGAAGKLAFLPAWLANPGSVLLITVFLLLFCIKNWLGYVISRANFTFINKVALRISRTNLFNYQQAAFSEFVQADSSEHIRNICFRPFEFSQYMLSGFQQIVTQLALIIITIIAIILFDAKLFLLLLLLILPPVVIVFGYIKKRMAGTRKNIQHYNELSIKYVLDALKGYVESNIYNSNRFFLDRFMAARQKFGNAVFDVLALQSLPGRIIEIFAVLGLFILIIIATWSGAANESMLIVIGAFMAAAYKIIPGIVKVINVSGQVKAYESSLDYLTENKEEKPTQVHGIPATELVSIELKNIGFNYGAVPVIKDFSLLINKGDFIGITGQSGKGKTTLLNLVLGFLPAAKGEIIFNNILAESEEIKSYWPCIAYVRQQHFFIHDTLLRNITLEEHGYNKEQLHDALQISGLHKLVATFPEGLEKIITENGKNISGGQQQRIAIARALYKNADCILLDEPFNELDEDASIAMLEHFRKLAAAGKSVLMITHDKKSLSYCNKIISLDD